jgi:hypothetical protein
MKLNILPEKRKSRFDEGLAERVNKLAEEEARREKLEARLKERAEKAQQKMPKQIVIAADIYHLCQGYEEFMRIANSPSHPREFIPTELTDKYSPTKEQILEFSRTLIDYFCVCGFSDYTARYITALMQSSKDTEFVLDLTELGVLIHKLGFKLKDKNLIINGNVGDGVGAGASNSQITVIGNAGCDAGAFMAGSQLTVHGNVGSDVCKYAGDSIIRIHGNAGYVGDYATDCQIYVKGTCRLSDYLGKGTEVHIWQNGCWEQVNPK